MLPRLVIDGYNVLFLHPAFQDLSDRDTLETESLEGVEGLASPKFGNDIFDRARQHLISDIAAYAQNSYHAVVVFDGTKNVSRGSKNYVTAGVEVVYSRYGESADTVIEKLVTECRSCAQSVILVTNDSTIKSTVAGDNITFMSSDLFIKELSTMKIGIQKELDERSYTKFTLGSMLDEATLKKLNEIAGRQED